VGRSARCRAVDEFLIEHRLEADSCGHRFRRAFAFEQLLEGGGHLVEGEFAGRQVSGDLFEMREDRLEFGPGEQKRAAERLAHEAEHDVPEQRAFGRHEAQVDFG
jgi:hypothetical protein